MLGRYLDSESDLLVERGAVRRARLTSRASRGSRSPRSSSLTLVLSVDFNLERLYRRERGEAREARLPAARGSPRCSARVYDVVYAPQDRLVERLRRAAPPAARRRPAARLAYHDRATLAVVANFGLSTQLAALGLCLALGRARRPTSGSRSAAGSRSSRWSCGVSGGAQL